MSTVIEAAGTALTLLRQQLAGEPLPQFQSPEADGIRNALSVLSARADDADLERIGRAVLYLLLETWTAHLLAERAATLAQLAAQSGKPDDHGGLH